MGLELLEKNTQQLFAHSGKIREFIESLLDKQSFVETDAFLSGTSELYGEVPYGEGVVTGYGSIDGFPVCVAAQNPEVLRGSLGKAQAEKIYKIARRAINDGLPLISIIDSAGVRLGEGLPALDAFGKVIAAINELRMTAPHFTVVKGTATGLMSVYAELSDIVFMGDAGSLSLTSPSVLSAKAGHDKKAADIVGAATHTQKSGLVSLRYKDTEELRSLTASLLEYLNGDILDNSDDPNRTSAALNETVNKENLLAALADGGKYIELNAAFAPEAATVLSSVNNLPAGIIVTDGKALNKNSIKKIKGFVKLLDKFGITLINLVNSEGIATTLQDEESGVSRAAAKLFAAVASSDIVKVSVVTGSAIGAAYTALCSKSLGYDYVLAFPGAKLSPITAEAAVGMFDADKLIGAEDALKKREELIAAYENMQANPFVSAKEGGVDNIIEPALLRPYIASLLTLKVR